MYIRKVFLKELFAETNYLGRKERSFERVDIHAAELEIRQ